VLLNLPARSGSKNSLVESAFKKAMAMKPPIFVTKSAARRVTLGNFEDDFDRLRNVDWIVEAVVENLAIKQELMTRLEAVISDTAIVSTNTSGLPIHRIAEGRSLWFRERFLGTHFFNPPRYLKLLELIPTEDTKPEVLETMRQFGHVRLGKGAIVAKDTPNFIANRVGMYATMLGLNAFVSGDYTIEEIDVLTGTLVGRPKSGTFRTADVVGLDTLVRVLDNLYPAIARDESRDGFLVPELVRRLVETGTLGAKTGQGFYKKDRKTREILSLNRDTLAYESAKPMNLGDIRAISKMGDLGGRLRALYDDAGRAGQFFRSSILDTLGYSARRIPEIADSPLDIDRALRWGFGWQLGPFEMWDAIGFERVLSDMKATGVLVPDWIETLQRQGVRGFYGLDFENVEFGREGRISLGAVVTPQGLMALDVPDDELPLAVLKADESRTIWQNSEAALLYLGDRVALYEFRSKGNTLSAKVVEGLWQVLDLVEQGDYRGLVIGNDSENFSGGANLAEMAMLAQTGGGEAIAKMLVDFQNLLQRLHYFPKPVVTAMRGRALGGGCELVMASPHVVAAAESYIGLVEVSVGLIPGAGGLMRMAKRIAERAASDAASHHQPWLRRAFETIATATVSSSAYEAQELGFLEADATIVMNSDRRLAVAKSEVICRDRAGYAPPPDNPIYVCGSPARAVLDHAAYTMLQSGYASDYDRQLAHRVASVLTGGDLSAPAYVSEAYLLRLEKEHFVPLLDEPKTRDRIAHLLKTKKPLRN
ncbi:MAG: 3-hydroxyacyl-CoA dehydrogenase NAD-binding domain-containing protein, partial [Cyanobacteria bacterium J06639_1]